MDLEPVRIALAPEHFSEKEKPLARFEELSASTFRYASGVCALRISNDLGQIIALPFQGQQIWNAEFLGRTLTMRSMFPEPKPTTDYLENYGAFLIHCGITAMGGPGVGDTHPLHGELPNAPFQTAELLVGRSGGRAFMALTGSYQYTVAFSHNYVARPKVTMIAGSSRLAVDLTVTNLKHAPQELMYLAHINFRPVDGGKLIDGVPDDAKHIAVRADLPPQFVPSERSTSDSWKPSGGHRPVIGSCHQSRGSIQSSYSSCAMRQGRVVGRTACSFILTAQPISSAIGRVSYPSVFAGSAAMWIKMRMGLVLPATAEVSGYTAEKAKGNVRTLPPGGEFHCSYVCGALSPADADAMRSEIEALKSQAD